MGYSSEHTWTSLFHTSGPSLTSRAINLSHLWTHMNAHTQAGTHAHTHAYTHTFRSHELHVFFLCLAPGGPAGGVSVPVPALVSLPRRARLQEGLPQPTGSRAQVAEGVWRWPHCCPLPVSIPDNLIHTQVLTCTNAITGALVYASVLASSQATLKHTQEHQLFWMTV